VGRCVLCESTITEETDSEEHLIPNAIGGRKKVSGFLCRKCNSTAGDSWDAELARQLLPLCLLLDVSRERGDPPSLRVETTAGERLTIGPNGVLSLSSPEFVATPLPSGGTQYQIKPRTMAEARRILTDLKRKHPEIDVEVTLASAPMVETYPKGAVGHNLSIGGELAGRSMVKSCLAWAFTCGVDWSACKHAIGYLRSPLDPPCFGYYHDMDLVEGRPMGVPLHCLAVDADPTTGLILAYGEFFGFHRFVCLLGEEYEGLALRKTYAIDPRTGKDLDLSVRIAFSREDMEDIYAYKRTRPEDIKRAADAILGPTMQARMEAAQKQVVSKAFDEARTSCGAKPGETLTPEQRWNFSRIAAEKIAPFLLHQMKGLPLRDLPPDVLAAIQAGTRAEGTPPKT
jgi:hypothetical protein